MRTFSCLLLAVACTISQSIQASIIPSFSRTSTSITRRSKCLTTSTLAFVDGNHVRGGSTKTIKSCADADWKLALKAGVATALETIGLVGVIAGTKTLASRFSVPFLTKMVGGLPIVQWTSLGIVIFGSSAVKSVTDGGVSVASAQVFRPNVTPGDPNWYSNLKKPWFNPPAWVFPVMWLIVAKPTQLWAVSRVLKRTSTIPYWPTLSVYCAHLSLGDTWNQIFFGCQRIRLGSGVITAFWGMLAFSSKLFANIDPAAGYLLLPTLAWVTVASSLNFSIDRLNVD